jgi:hypothetical protein
MNKSHKYTDGMPSYQISPYLQERYVLAGQSEVYDKCNDLISKFLRVEANAMQVHRVTNTYGELSGDLINVESVKPLKEMSKQDVVYAQMDGGMVLTRENGWQEIKVGRLFRQSDIHVMSPKRQEILDSIYTAHLGDHKAFCQQFEPLVDEFEPLQDRLVFITDGAKWIKNWIKENYPKATAILDYYHASEYIGKWCDWTFPDKVVRKDKVEQYRHVLLEKGIHVLLSLLEKDVNTMNKRTQTTENEQVKILDYFKGNAYRMDYPQYILRGLCIGSGAIEASHRTVVQKRMKLSGQRWSEQRVHNMLNLRTAKMSGLWDNVVHIIRNQHKMAA